MSRDCFVYWIHRPSDSDIFSQGYVGVSVNPEYRFKMHKYTARRGKLHKLYNSMRKHGDYSLKIILKGSIEYCYDVEFKLRSSANIGLNHAVGGKDSSSSRLSYRFDTDVKSIIKQGLRRAFEENEEYRRSVKLRNKGKILTSDTKHKMSESHKGKGTKWLNPSSDLSVWAKADIYYLAYLKMLDECVNKKGRLSFSPQIFEQISGLAVAKSGSILKSFRAGWIPTLDSDWLNTFKK